MEANVNGITFTDSDVVTPDRFIPDGEYNPHNVRPWLLHDHGFVLAVVFACCLSDAFDEAADAGKLEAFRVTEDEISDYSDEEQEGLDYLGNYGHPYDIESLCFVELENPPRSFVAQFNAARDI